MLSLAASATTGHGGISILFSVADMATTTTANKRRRSNAIQYGNVSNMIHYQLHTTTVRVSLIPAYVLAPHHACHHQLGKYNSKQRHGTAIDNDDETTTEQ
jgi:hypothetical protein